MTAIRGLPVIVSLVLVTALPSCCGHAGAVRDAQNQFNQLSSSPRSAGRAPRTVHDGYLDIETDLSRTRAECEADMRAEGLLGTAEALRLRARARRAYWGHIASIAGTPPDELLAPQDVGSAADALRQGELADQIHDRDRVLLRLIPATAAFDGGAITMSRHQAANTWEASVGEATLTSMLVSDVDVEGLMTTEADVLDHHRSLTVQLVRWRWQILRTIRTEVYNLGLWARPSSAALISDLNSRMAALWTSEVIHVLQDVEKTNLILELKPI